MLEEEEKDLVIKNTLAKIYKKKKVKVKKNTSKLTISKPAYRCGCPIGKDKEIVWDIVKGTADNSLASEFK